MRLICPNCGAQYEVPDGVIPAQGRDVQCSNCANTWFQAHPDHDAPLAEELGLELEHDLPAEAPEVAPEPDPEPEPEPAPAKAQPARRELDPAIADLLREEAEFEARQRAAEAEADMQTQPELGLDAPASEPASEAPSDPAPEEITEDTQDEASRRAHEARTRMERRKGAPLESDIGPDFGDVTEENMEDLAEHVASRRELLPDIEEINSSLDAEVRKPAQSDDHATPGTEGLPPQRKSRGFSGGFLIGVLVIALLWSVYTFAGQISAQVPQLAGPLDSYTRTVDSGRDWLDGQIKSLLVKLNEMAAASEE